MKDVRRWSVSVLCLLLVFVFLSTSAFADYGDGDWSNGWGWWSQGQSAYSGVRGYGCLIVAQAKMLAAEGIGSNNTNVFNPDIYYEWEVANGYVNEGMYTLSYAGPEAYADACGKTMYYEGVTYGNNHDKVWDNIYNGKYSILRIYCPGSHYILVNNSASIETGHIRIFQSWDSATIPGTRDLEHEISEILTYSAPTIPTTGIIDVNGRLDGKDVGNTSGYGTFDIYINGSIAGDDVSDYYNSALSAGTSYSITDIKATTGHIYNGSIGNTSGSIAAGNTVDVRLKFDTCTSHSYGAGVITKNATCTESGVKTFTCTKCGSTKTETIPKLAHTPVVDPAVPATVTKTGLTEGSHCSVCGTVIIAQQVVPKLPRVPYDFDMDGVAEPVMTLPGALKNIEASAFEGGTAKVVIIPDGTTTIGSRAFADMPSLIAVFIPESVTTISFDVFEGSPNVKLYVAKGSRWGARLNLPAVEIENGWVLADNVPMGAEITDRKWTYTTREYKESSSASYPGWTKYKTQKTWSAWSGWQNSEISANSDREVRTQTIVTGYNMISYCVSGPNGRSYQPSPTYTVRLQHGPYWWSKAELDSARVFYAGSYFDYESNVAGYVLDGTAYCKWDGSDTGGYIPMFIQETFYGTQWSYRDAAYTYFYYRDFNGESATDPSGQGNVSNVQEWVKYSY